MKNLLTKALGLGLCGAGLLFLASCAAQKGTLSPNTSLIGANNSVSTRLPRISSQTLPSSVYQKLFIDFDADMDPASINSATVKIYQLFDVTGTPVYTDENEVTNVVLSYDASNRRLTIVHGTNTWPNNTAYRVLVTNGVHSLTGRPLDGNFNGIAESVEFDSYTKSFSLGTPSVTYAYTSTPFQVSTLTVRGKGGSDLDLVTNSGPSFQANINHNYSYVTITVGFNAGFDDISLLNNANTMLTNGDSGVQISPVKVSITATNAIYVEYALDAATRYKVTMKGGLTGFRSATNKTVALSPLFGRYFDNHKSTAPGTYYAEASDDLVSYFTTVTSNEVAVTPVTVATVTPDTTNRKFTISFAITEIVSDATNSKRRLDPTTVTTANFQLLATYNFVTYQIPVKQLVFDGVNTVDVYLPDTFYPNDTISVPVKVKILHNVRSVENIYLNSDSNSIGGETTDDYTSSTTSFDARPEYSPI